MSSYSLVLDASEGALHIVVGKNDCLYAFESLYLDNKATEFLMHILSSLFDRYGIALSDIDRIACVCGPGSFTGIRLLLTTTAALRRCAPIRLGELSYMQVLAFEALQTLEMEEGSHISVLTHARKNCVHFQNFVVLKKEPVAIGAIALFDPAALFAKIPKGSVLIGSGITRNKEVFCNAKMQGFCKILKKYPSAQALCTAASSCSYANADLEPLYVRGLDCLESLNRLATRQGLDAVSAHALFDSLTMRDPKESLHLL